MLKPLDKTKFATEIIKDLGMQTKEGNKRKMRYVLLRCNECGEGFEKTVDNAIRRKETTCNKCIFTKDLKLPAKVLEYRTSTEVVFECNRCGLDYTMTLANAKNHNKYGVCKQCRDEDRDDTLSTDNIFKKLNYNPDTGSLTYKYDLANAQENTEGKELHVLLDGRVKFCGSRAVPKARLCLWLYYGYDVLEGKKRPIGFKNNDNTDFRIDNLEVGRMYSYPKYRKDGFTRKKKYTKQDIRSVFLQCDYKEQIKDRFVVHYRYAIRQGWYSELTKGIPTLRRKWSLLSACRAAKVYKTREDFKRGCEGAYDYIRHKYPQYRDRIYRHMEYGSNSDNDAIYVWKAVGLQNVYKIGITSARLEDIRIKAVAKAAQLDYDIVIIKKVDDALTLEKRLHNMFKEHKFQIKFDGSTEFRVLDKEELQQALNIIEGYNNG